MARHCRFLPYIGKATIIFIFWDSLMFYQIFLSPQVKRCAIITYILHHKWNDARLLLINMVYIQSMRTPVTLTNTLSSPTNPITPRDPANHAHPSTYATPPTPNRELNTPPNLERESEEFPFLIAIHSTQGWTATTRLKTKKKKRWKGCPLT